MRIVFSEHSIAQNKIRRIPISKIKAVIQTPDRVKPSFRNRNLYQKAFGSKILEVVAIIEGREIVVITQYYLEVK